ncbi:MAG: hypothetical protein PUF62_04655 [Bacteroidales bacterium]|nr:hypothetical protein [Bacteroidales bacterium]
MEITKFIAQFLYRIRYWLFWGSFFITLLTIYFTQFLPYSYTVEGSLYAGVTNEISIDGSRVNSFTINSTFDNLIGIAKSQSTLQRVSIRLLAISLTYGEEWKDNQYIQALHYRQLLQTTPKEVLALVDRKDVNKTAEALTNYHKNNKGNFVYIKFNQGGAFYSLAALENINIVRVTTSDILKLSYTSADPGLTQQTLLLLIEELRAAYEEIRFSAINDVISYFEDQVKKSKKELSDAEDDLTRYNIQERVINYTEESKALAITRYEVDDRLEEVMRRYESAVALRKLLDEKMDVRAQTIINQSNLLKNLDKISTTTQDIMKREIFISDKNHESDNELTKKKNLLKETEEQISDLSDNINALNFTKEGVSIKSMVDEWLQALVEEAKSGAELQVLLDRQQDIFDQYEKMSPVGTQTQRKERAISFAENYYSAQIDGLNKAILQKRNTEMNSTNLKDVSVPEYPLKDNGRKRSLYVIIAFLGSIVFIIIYFLIIELLDHTLRDAERSERLTGLPVIAAFNGTSNLKFRGFLKTCNRIAASYACRQLSRYLQPGRPTVINLLSIHSSEGKSFLSKYLRNQWGVQGLRVRIVVAGEDFNTKDGSFMRATQLSDFWQLNEAEQIPDIILIEYPALHKSAIPLQVLQKADANLLVANAKRLWREDDDKIISPIRESMNGTPLWIYLNNADREVVESFTGTLPPITPLHSYLTQLAQLGLTSCKAAVK